jgi:hypothetical protein
MVAELQLDRMRVQVVLVSISASWCDWMSSLFRAWNVMRVLSVGLSRTVWRKRQRVKTRSMKFSHGKHP